MRHAALWAGACAVLLPLAAAAQDAPAPAAAAPAPAARPSPVPRYNWVQAEFVSSYTTFGEDAGEFRIGSEGGYRLTGSLLLTKPFYLTGSYGNQAYSFRDTLGKAEVDDSTWFAGAGAFFPLSPSTHVTAALSYEGGRLDTGDGDIDANGFGLELGLRLQATPSVETALAYKYRDQTLDLANGETDRTGHAFSAALVGNLSRNVALLLKLERNLFTEDRGGGDEEDSNVEAYSVGVRLRL